MAIILEGPDASGKTTLARMLCRQFGLKHLAAGGAPKTHADVVAYCLRQQAACSDRDIVIDRITPISHPVYHPDYRGHAGLMKFLNDMLDHPSTLIIYCRPPTDAMMSLEKHQWKDYDTEEHKQKIINNLHGFIDYYDEVFSKIPHLPYDYTVLDSDFQVELIAMLAASVTSDKHLASLRELCSPIYVKRFQRNSVS